jgi:hypothetical protein
MKVSDAIRVLKYAELSQLKVKDDVEGVITFLDSGILEIHKRVALLKGSAVITPVEGKFEYSLGGADTDVVLPHAGAVLVATEAFDAAGCELPLNKRQDEDTIKTTTLDTILLPNTTNSGEVVFITCQMTPTSLEDEESDIPIPQQLIEALFHYVGYRAHTAMTGSGKDEAYVNYVRFENSIKKVIDEDLFNKADLGCDKFDSRGFL